MSSQKESMGGGEEKVHPDYELIAEKLLICRAATIEQFGFSNVYHAVENLYTALYNPADVDKLIKPNEDYPLRMDVLKKHLSVKLEKIPTKEEFVAKVRHVITREVDFDKCFSEEAKKQFHDVFAKSETTIVWTDGDALGIPEQQLPGSYEQICKIGSAKFFNKMRREIAQKRGVDYKDILLVVAIEGKMGFIPSLIKMLREKGVERVVIIEDRIKNLNLAMDLVQENSDMEVFPVWVRHGQHKDKLEGKSEEMLELLHPINDISELMALLEENSIFSEKKVGTIFDMDGVLASDDIRRKIQAEAVVKALQEKGWI